MGISVCNDQVIRCSCCGDGERQGAVADVLFAFLKI